MRSSSAAWSAASDAVLVGVMMQYAVESNILDFLDVQHAALKPATRVVLAGGMKRPPYRSTVADAVMREKRIFHTWMLGRLEKIRGQKADDATVLSNFRREVSTFFSVESAELDTMFEASGRTGTA